jgi:16S rRNA G966 N2-methylase RsmD
MHLSPRVTLDALVVIESRSTSDPPTLPPSFTLEEERIYGDTRLLFVRRTAVP